jgi:hypothetical protein
VLDSCVCGRVRRGTRTSQAPTPRCLSVCVGRLVVSSLCCLPVVCVQPCAWWCLWLSLLAARRSTAAGRSPLATVTAAADPPARHSSCTALRSTLSIAANLTNSTCHSVRRCKQTQPQQQQQRKHSGTAQRRAASDRQQSARVDRRIESDRPPPPRSLAAPAPAAAVAAVAAAGALAPTRSRSPCRTK